jgi:hypothetical protein
MGAYKQQQAESESPGLFAGFFFIDKDLVRNAGYSL